MKTIIYIFILVTCISSCKNESTENNEMTTEVETNVEKPLTLDGTWELVSYYNYMDNEISDTIKAGNGFRQVKMYSHNKVMWSRMVPRDSTEFFGYGAYVVEDLELTETLEYGSAAMLKIIDTMRVFSFEVIINDDSYSQIQIGPEGDRVFSENYNRIK